MKIKMNVKNNDKRIEVDFITFILNILVFLSIY